MDFVRILTKPTPARARRRSLSVSDTCPNPIEPVAVGRGKNSPLSLLFTFGHLSKSERPHTRTDREDSIPHPHIVRIIEDLAGTR